MQKLMFLSLFLLAQIGSLAPAFAQEAPKQFRIQNIVSSGDGCPQGTVASNISDDQEAFTLSFSDFFAEIGPGIDRAERRKTCRLSFVTEHEPGWEFAVLGITHRGAVSLEKGVTAKQTLRQGWPQQSQVFSQQYRGPLDQDYVQSLRVGFADLQWSGCRRKPQAGRVYEVQSSVELSSRRPDARGLMTVDSIDGEVKQVFDILWRHCEPRVTRVLAVCTLTGTANSFPQILAKAQAPRASQALDKARRKLENRCLEATGALDSCDVAQARCEVQSLRL